MSGFSEQVFDRTLIGNDLELERSGVSADLENRLQQAVFDDDFLFRAGLAAVAAGKVAAGFDGGFSAVWLIEDAHLVFNVKSVAPAVADAACVTEEPSAVDFAQRLGVSELFEFERE